MPDEKTRIVLLCTDSPSSRIMYHGLSSHVDIAAVIIENPVSLMHFVRRRIKKLGLMATAGQLLFIACNKLMARFSARRIAELISVYELNDAPLPENLSIRVRTVNGSETIGLLREFKPDAVVINGTRLLSKEVLDAVEAPFINTHMGMTPRYRGVHGGYWALANKDRENCGVTVHLVDTGIDTGGVLYQDTIEIDDNDNFNTYPIHQIAKAIPLMKTALDDVRAHSIRIAPGVSPSRLWHHPTLFGYIRNRILLAVK
ncbi:formyl transferase [Methylococcus geothermalis]|uniref:phosphoribosylglycinamide formyltransferase 1 n=1 Tax=Methylococcus geothermalis TaxID=2681310 RepID=A0A858QBQ1_9GAMM|nr:formyl transferase [Methylococcus geothermalis]QJD31135.1 formyl transferase [Methylococcus geothermalis]